jgi:hypothetical protein
MPRIDGSGPIEPERIDEPAAEARVSPCCAHGRSAARALVEESWKSRDPDTAPRGKFPATIVLSREPR